MRVADLEKCVETWFDCRDGDYGRYAHLVFEQTSPDSARISHISTGEYVTMRRVQPKSIYTTNDIVYMEHCLVSGFIAQFDMIQRRMARAGIQRPKLFWRFAPGHRFQLEESDEGTMLRTRVYIEGCSDYGEYAVPYEAPNLLRVVPSDGGAHSAEHMRSMMEFTAMVKASEVKLLPSPDATMTDNDTPAA